MAEPREQLNPEVNQAAPDEPVDAPGADRTPGEDPRPGSDADTHVPTPATDDAGALGEPEP